jgi:hypothetical protein
VRYKDTPVTSGLVTFYGPDYQTADAYIQPDGTYQGTNVPLGQVTITVRPRPPVPRAAKAKAQLVHRDLPQGPEVDTVELPKEYADPAKSGLTVTVTGGPQPFDIEMK